MDENFDPNYKWGIPREWFRFTILTLSCVIGGICYFMLKPPKILPEIEERNMHFFAKLNADPNVTVTYSGLMYRV